MKKRLVVIGNGMAALRTLEELLRLAPDDYDITVFGAELWPAYNRILLTPVLAGDIGLDDIVLRDRAWYDAHRICLQTGVRIVQIDRARRTVLAANGLTVHYDRLLIATGSQPAILDVPGNTLQGVLTYRDIADAERLIAVSKVARKAVVIGGGLLGLEAANGLAQRGLAVTVVHQSAWIMNRQLDAQAAGFVQAALESRGIHFHLGAKTAGILSNNGSVCALRLAGGETVETDLVVMALGIRPDCALAEAAGIHCDDGIVVNDVMQSFDPRIYAVGECVSHRGVRYGLVAPLHEQALVCANQLAELGRMRYPGSRVCTKLKISGIPVFSTGNIAGGEGCEDLVYCDPAQGIYKHLVLRDNALEGALLCGDIADGAWYFSLIGQGSDLSAQRDTLLFGCGVRHEGGA